MNKSSQNETLSIILLAVVAFAVGSGITCHMVSKHYKLKMQIMEQEYKTSKPTEKVEDFSKDIKYLEKSIEDLKSSKEQLALLDRKIEELIRSKEAQPVVIKEDKRDNSDEIIQLIRTLKNQINAQNQQILTLNEKLLSTQHSMKDVSSSSVLNEQKLNEIKAMLRNNPQQPQRPTESAIARPTLETEIKKNTAPQPTQPSVQEATKVYKQERLSVKSNLPPDYESPKINYKNDELK